MQFLGVYELITENFKDFFKQFRCNSLLPKKNIFPLQVLATKLRFN